MAYLLQQLANSIPVAALYAALAFGYATAFAMTRRADIVYGAIFAFSGQIFLLFANFGWSKLYLVLPVALALGSTAALVYGLAAGWWIARKVMLPLVRSSANAVLVASLGLVLVLEESARLAMQSRSIWLAPFLNQRLIFWNDGAFSVSLTVIQLLNAALMTAIVMFGGGVLARSRAGRIWRAVADDAFAARLMGIDSDRVFVVAYGAATLTAATCGVLATAHYGTMDFGAGMVFGLKVVLLAAIGGHAMPMRAAGGAALYGLIETLWGAYLPFLWRDAVLFSALVGLAVVTRQERAIP
ncbi:branched-chain amino acid ABC transporter permease [Rhizobium halophytocola]|uniref:Branched-chain amino acid transport system permease protein n=1 Tax=Rhizobium halophytocola TaxID=735519 RepID=A0ABS4DYI4_9HYPH|nr:branched-chain amino acid ABC transporter permease [Rhizobium halophytocola]MBP1850730.1 branched-chain amino acid transport system permease protein [Rhizobium halophytocola]